MATDITAVRVLQRYDLQQRRQTSLQCLRYVTVAVALVQGTRRHLNDKARGFDEINLDPWLALSFGIANTTGSHAHAGVAICIDQNTLPVHNIVNVWRPSDSCCTGRAGLVRLKCLELIQCSFRPTCRQWTNTDRSEVRLTTYRNLSVKP